MGRGHHIPQMPDKQRTKELEREEGARATVPEGTRVYAIGDIHGRLDLLQSLLQGIISDSREAPVARNLLIFLGDYVDRGPDSKGTIDFLINKLPGGFEPVFLKGNHEDLMLDFLAARGMEAREHSGEGWLMNGGDTTLESYDVSVPDHAMGVVPDEDLLTAARELKEQVPETHLSFLKNLKYYHVEGDFLFVHAGLRPGVSLARQSEADMMWIRDVFLSHTGFFDGHIVVHGHSIKPTPDVQATRIGIDTGAWYSNRLTALALEGDEYWFLYT